MAAPASSGAADQTFEIVDAAQVATERIVERLHLGEQGRPQLEGRRGSAAAGGRTLEQHLAADTIECEDGAPCARAASNW